MKIPDRLNPFALQGFSENVILVDANYVADAVHDFKQNLESELKRELPNCNWATLLFCYAVDGAIPEGTRSTQVIFICRKGRTVLESMEPRDLLREVDGFAFQDARLGEFVMSVLEEEDAEVMQGASLLTEVGRVLLSAKEVKRVVTVLDWKCWAEAWHEVMEETKQRLAQGDETRELPTVTVVTSVPKDEANDAVKMREIGFSLLHSLGVDVEDLSR